MSTEMSATLHPPDHFVWDGRAAHRDHPRSNPKRVRHRNTPRTTAGGLQGDHPPRGLSYRYNTRSSVQSSRLSENHSRILLNDIPMSQHRYPGPHYWGQAACCDGAAGRPTHRHLLCGQFLSSGFRRKIGGEVISRDKGGGGKWST